ncbi:hypothetical protein ACQP25_44965 (plasmid) [Microtetraspora malaysiensis]|uniref:hypothetical protein n=1 Tax=Microtetraspora malaysiensis TaxID=161358 RepID=UPI003D90AD1E
MAARPTKKTTGDAPAAEASAAAPLAPPAEPKASAAEQVVPTSHAAPLLPPEEPTVPVETPAPAPDLRSVVTPGATFVDLKNGATGELAEPGDLWDDPGEPFTFVTARNPLIKVVVQPGARDTSETLFCAAGKRFSKEHARQIREGLAGLRAEQAAKAAAEE